MPRVNYWLGLWAVIGSLSACSSLHPSPAKVIETARTNITTSTNLSQSTTGILLSAGMDENRCLANFVACIKAVDTVYFVADDRRLATLAELYYAYARAQKNNSDCAPIARVPIHPEFANAPLSPSAIQATNQVRKQCQSTHLQALYEALRYSYAYVFYDNLTGKNTASNITSEAQIRTQDIYHLATYQLVNEAYLQDMGSFASAERILPDSISTSDTATFTHLNTFVLTAPNELRPTLAPITLHLQLANDPYFIKQLSDEGANALTALTSIYDTSLPSLNVISTREGLGVGYVGVLDGRHTLNLRNTSSSTKERIYPMGHLLMTALIVPEGETLTAVLDTTVFNGYFFNPYNTASVTIAGRDYPLYANFSSGYAKWLAENRFNRLALANMVIKGDVRLPELYMLEPYNPNKEVIIMLHGLASSPATWVQLTNSLLADPVLREHYQVWQVFYATNLPMLENRYQIQQLINDAFDQVDSHAHDKASHNAVIIAHSMGAVIARLMLSDDDLTTQLPIVSDPAKLNQLSQSTLAEHLQLSALSQVDTAVFISAPFRGTDYAERWFTRGLRKAIHLPLGITQAATTAITNLGDDVHKSPLAPLYLQNGASQLSNQSAFMALTANVQIAPHVRYHSIMANKTGDSAHIISNASSAISDGIVPYDSSYLAGATSETIVTGGHSIHESPETILHLRKILHDRLPKDTLANQ